MSYSYKITVFTPTYNRAYIIENLYRSLQRQSFTDFEWLVVDDGSSDNTEELFESFCREQNPFPIRYFKKENGGKCRAINRGLELAQGELFFTVDSDDYLTDDALEKVVQWEAELPKDQKFCGMIANRGTTPDSTPNPLFDWEYYDGNAFDLYNGFDGEKALIFYTDIHRKYLYPEFDGEKFMTEAVTWNRMAWDGYKIRYFNDIIWIWEYIADGLTKAGYKVFLDNPQGTALFFREKAVYFNYDLKTKLGMWYGYICDAKHKRTESQIAEDIAMPRWLVKPMKFVDSTWKFIRNKR